MIPAAFLGLVGVVLADEGHRRTMRFEKDDVGKLPAGWEADQAGTGTGSRWKVVEDDTAPSRTGYVLAQTAASPNDFIALCIAKDTHYEDVEISVTFKAVRGTNNRGDGVVWRYQDHDNFYLARMNLRDDNFRACKVMNGRRIERNAGRLRAIRPLPPCLTEGRAGLRREGTQLFAPPARSEWRR
jgi:hypothetical protein